MNDEFKRYKNNVKEKTEELFSVCREAVGSGKTVAVTGHDSPDCDSVLSACLMRKLLQKGGIGCRVKFGTLPDPVTKRTIEDLGSGIDVTYDGFDEDDVLLLVDHHKCFYDHAVLGCVDHHTTPPEPDYGYNFVEKASSCGRMIFDMMCSIGLEDEESEIASLYSVYLDTQSCRSLKFLESDKEWVENCIKKYSLDREQLTRLGFCLNDPTSPTEELALCAFKRYEFCGKIGISSCIQTDNAGACAIERRMPEIFEYVEKYLNDKHAFLCAYIVNNPEIEKSDIYFIEADGRRRRVPLDRLASRSRDVIPVVKALAEALA